MAYTVSLYELSDLANGDKKNEILLNTNKGTELHITSNETGTVITLPFGNKFDIIDGQIIIHSK